ncbi:twin-arginine translocase TatA/TatE family subunit [Robertkochia solimangrovi]|nr:twin-arginine translocase TatA/TatE family subunit [Robertkochia solimangrovi]
MMFLFISGPEVVFILFIVIMVFGADKLPEIARGLGKGMRQLKDATNEVKNEIQRSAEKQGIDTTFAKDIQKEIDQVRDNIDDFTGSVKRKL